MPQKTRQTCSNYYEQETYDIMDNPLLKNPQALSAFSAFTTLLGSFGGDATAMMSSLSALAPRPLNSKDSDSGLQSTHTPKASDMEDTHNSSSAQPSPPDKTENDAQSPDHHNDNHDNQVPPGPQSESESETTAQEAEDIAVHLQDDDNNNSVTASIAFTLQELLDDTINGVPVEKIPKPEGTGGHEFNVCEAIGVTDDMPCILSITGMANI
ncbi:hypothetical protein K439DRAFT_1617333 [Ramaria rubella]|nr:hypothetical protein K439DRAFT_1617333 [Ramaria rubella]